MTPLFQQEMLELQTRIHRFITHYSSKEETKISLAIQYLTSGKREILLTLRNPDWSQHIYFYNFHSFGQNEMQILSLILSLTLKGVIESNAKIQATE